MSSLIMNKGQWPEHHPIGNMGGGKIKVIHLLVERTFASLFGRNIVLNSRGANSAQCLLYQDCGDPNIKRSIKYCDLDSRRNCRGEIRNCKHPEALKEYLSERGLGWKEAKKDERSAGGPKKGSTEDPVPASIIEYIYTLPKSLLVLIAFVLSLLVGILNHFAGPELSSSVFYLIPISLVTWFTRRWMGIIMSIVCVFTWLSADFTSGASFSSQSIPYWNGAARFASFFIFTLVLAALKNVVAHEKESSRVDFLTGVRNRRCFIELADMEIKRARRYQSAFSVVYIDLDNFKLVNDCFGHSAGDNLLCLIANAIENNIRGTDTLARLGGDEFAILLPETGPELARVIAQRIQKVNSDIMRKYEWPVTLSMGVVTFAKGPSAVDDLLKISDALMYAAKKNGKNTIHYEVFSKEEAFSLATVA